MRSLPLLFREQTALSFWQIVHLSIVSTHSRKNKGSHFLIFKKKLTTSCFGSILSNMGIEKYMAYQKIMACENEALSDRITTGGL